MTSTLLRGGIVLPDATSRPASALHVVDRQVAWVGDLGSSGAPDPSTVDEVVDLEGALVTPGFSDSHVHVTMTGQGLDGLDLSRTTSIPEALALIEQAARASRGRPVYAHSWDETRWAEGRAITAAELDRATYGGVVYMPRVDAHSASISTAMATVSRASFLDGWEGEGLVRREAYAAATHAFTSSITPDDRARHISLTLDNAAARGLTLLHETGATHLTGHDDIRDVLEAGRAEGVPEVVGYWGELADDPTVAGDLAAYLGVHGLAGDLCADGSFGSLTAHLGSPYLDSDEHGYGYLSVEQVRDHVIACTTAGLQAGAHVIGDEALRTMAAGFRAAADVLGVEAIRAARHRWEHVELPDDSVIATMADLGIWASIQPAFDALWGGVDGLYAARLGAERALAALPLRSLVDAGVRLALSSDSPVTRLGPWEAVRAAAHHHNPQQSITVAEAFDAHTRGGYELAGRSGGVLRVGRAATYVVWDDGAGRPVATDPATGLPVFASPDAPVPHARTTVVAGVTAYSRA